MKHLLIATLALGLVTSCGSKKDSKEAVKTDAPKEMKDAPVKKYATSITQEELREQLYFYASDEMEGRSTGTAGQKRAVEYIKKQYQDMKVAGGMLDGEYFQTIPQEYFAKIDTDSENVLAFIEGSEKPEEVLVLSAHLDHVGMHDGEVFNGADDDGSGTIALIEIAEAFQQAKNEGYGPKRSILFLHVTAEEIGLHGSRYYSENPVYPLDMTIANLNVDMIGRIDPAQAEDPSYVYLIGSDMLSQDLHNVSEEAHKIYESPIRLDYTYNGKDDPNRFYYRSDHYNFAKNNIPVIFYFNGTHEDYHKATDTPDKIEYELLQGRTQLIFYTAWELANRDNRPELSVQE
jgi:Zn-dependent M28 family amino/carboxypeptidase